MNIQLPLWIEQGGVVAILLMGLSCISLTIIIERMVFWIWLKFHFSENKIKNYFSQIKKDPKSMNRECDDDNGFIKLLFQNTYNNQINREEVDLGLDRLAMQMKRFLPGLDTIVTIAPLLGIFGTVVGIIHSFHFLGGTQIQTQEVSQGLSTALITTAMGLGIAMPSLLFYNFFMNLAENFLYRLELYLQEYIILLRDIYIEKSS